MSNKPSVSSKTALPQGADDFKRINGIRQGIDSRLHRAGIHTYAQLADLSPGDIAASIGNVPGVSAERIVQQDWIGQARLLAEERAMNESQEVLAELGPTEQQSNEVVGAGPQHYELFEVELLLDEENNVRRTRVKYATRAEESVEKTWGGWDTACLNAFFVQHAAIRLPTTEPAPMAAAQIVHALSVASQEPVIRAPEPAAPSTAVATLSGALRLRALETMASESGNPVTTLRHSQPLNVRLTLDLSDVAAPADMPLNYTAAVYVKNLESGKRMTMGEAHGTLVQAHRASVDLESAGLPQGIYRIEATMVLALPSTVSLPQAGLMAYTEGGLIQVY